MDADDTKPASSARSMKRRQQRTRTKERLKTQESSLSQTNTSVKEQTEGIISTDTQQPPKVVSPLAKVLSEQFSEISTTITRNPVQAKGRAMCKFGFRESLILFALHQSTKENPSTYALARIKRQPEHRRDELLNRPDWLIKDDMPSDINIPLSSPNPLLSSDMLKQYWRSINPPIQTTDSEDPSVEETDSEHHTKKNPSNKWTPTTYSWEELTEIMHDMKYPMEDQIYARHMQCKLIQMGKGPPQTKPQSSNATVTTTVEAEEPVSTEARPKTQQTSELPHAIYKTAEVSTQTCIPTKEAVSQSDKILFTPQEEEEMRNNSTKLQVLEEQFDTHLQNIQATTDEYQQTLSAVIEHTQGTFQIVTDKYQQIMSSHKQKVLRKFTDKYQEILSSHIAEDQTTLKELTDNYQQNLSAQIAQAQKVLAEMSQIQIKQRDTTDGLCQLLDESMKFTQHRD